MPKRGQNIYKRKDGRWEGRIMIARAENGKAKYKYVYGKTYKQVKEKMFDIIKTQNSSQLISETNHLKYKDLLENWLSYKKSFVKESTYVKYKNSIKLHINPFLGNLYMADITSSCIEKHLLSLLCCETIDGKGGLSLKTVNDISSIIRNSFRYASFLGITSVCNLKAFPTPKSSSAVTLTSAEVTSLTNFLTQNTDEYKAGILLCLITGIRIGELCALKWENFSFEEKTIKIEKTLQRLQNTDKTAALKTKISLTSPKSISSSRTIPLPEFFLDIIRPLQNQQDTYFLTGKPQKPSEPRNVQNRFKSYLALCGIRDIKFHSLRHTFATICVESGVDIKSLSEILGHSSVKITLDKYVHTTMETKRKNMEKLPFSALCV